MNSSQRPGALQPSLKKKTAISGISAWRRVPKVWKTHANGCIRRQPESLSDAVIELLVVLDQGGANLMRTSRSTTPAARVDALTDPAVVHDQTSEAELTLDRPLCHVGVLNARPRDEDARPPHDAAVDLEPALGRTLGSDSCESAEPE